MESIRKSRVLVADMLDPRALRAIEGDDVEVVDRAGISARELAEAIADFDALVVRSRTRVDADLLGRAARLKVVGRAGTGVDNIDVDAASRRGVVVMNTPGGNSNSAAEHTIALLFALARHVPAAHAALVQGRFEPKLFTGVEVARKVLGVVGLGRIGLLVAEKARGLGMTVIGYDPVVGDERARAAGVEPLPLDALLARADFITLHVPLLESTRHLIDDAALRRVQPHVRIINCARGGVLDEAAAERALDEGRIAGLALDVFETEPPSPGRLLSLANVVATPHLGASTAEAQESVAVAVIRQIGDFLRGRGVAGAVNAMSMDADTAMRLRPYCLLAEKMGGIVGGYAPRTTTVASTVFGAALGGFGRLLTAHFLKGMQRPYLGDEVNEYNAIAVAGERGIEVTESEVGEHPSYQMALLFRAEGGETVELEGAVFGRSQGRVVRWDDFDVDFMPEDRLLLVLNKDQPGVMGRIGTLLGESGVNIANMSLGRDPIREKALCVLSLDTVPAADVLADVKALPGVLAVRLILLEGSP